MFLQCFTTCQPEHGVADDMALHQAQRVRDSRGVPEFVFDPRTGRELPGSAGRQGQSQHGSRLVRDQAQGHRRNPRYTVAHWCTTEARFRNHLKKIKPEAAEKLIHLDNMLVRITQQDVVYRRYLNPAHRSFIPGLRRVHQVRGERQDRVPRAVPATGDVLRRAPQGMADAAVQGRRGQEREYTRRRRCWRKWMQARSRRKSSSPTPTKCWPRNLAPQLRRSPRLNHHHHSTNREGGPDGPSSSFPCLRLFGSQRLHRIHRRCPPRRQITGKPSLPRTAQSPQSHT